MQWYAAMTVGHHEISIGQGGKYRPGNTAPVFPEQPWIMLI